MAKFKYSKANAEYRHANGKPVRPQTINEWVKATIENAQASVRADTQAMADRKLSIDKWRDRMREHIRAGHRNMSKLAYGPKLSAKELGRLGAIVKAQYRYLDKFAAGLKARSIPRSAATANRAALYIRAMWATFQNELKRAKLDAGFTTCINVLDDEADSCTECPDLTDKGEIAIADMPNVGTRKCALGCRCSIEYFRG